MAESPARQATDHHGPSFAGRAPGAAARAALAPERASTAPSSATRDPRAAVAAGAQGAGGAAGGGTWVPEGWLAEQLARARVPGAAGVLVDREWGLRPLVWGRRGPWPGAAPVGPSTLFRWYSLTKPVTAALASRLVREGRLDVRDPAETHLPELAPALGRRPGARPVRVADLLLHTAGLADRPLDAAAWFRAAGLAWPDPDRALAAVLGRRPRWTAGASGRSRYSNLGYAVLGQVLARVGGAPFRELVQRRVLEPLGVAAAFAFDQLPRDAPRSEGVVSLWSTMGLALHSRRARHFVARRRGGWLWIRPREAVFSPHGGLVGRPAALAPLLRERLERRDDPLAGLEAREGPWARGRVLAGWYRRPWSGPGPLERHGGRGPGFTGEVAVAPALGRAVVLVVNRDLPGLASLCRRWLVRPGTDLERWREWHP